LHVQLIMQVACLLHGSSFVCTAFYAGQQTPHHVVVPAHKRMPLRSNVAPAMHTVLTQPAHILCINPLAVLPSCWPAGGP
jgi:hypothetical protein